MSQLLKGERYYWDIKGQGWIIGPAEADPGEAIRWRGREYVLVNVEGKLRVRETTQAKVES